MSSDSETRLEDLIETVQGLPSGDIQAFIANAPKEMRDELLNHVLADTEDYFEEDDEHLPPAPPEVRYYRIEGLVRGGAEGAFGLVYLAKKRGESLLVALKVMQPAAATEKLRARFAREIKILARLQHPNIAAFLDSGKTRDGQPYFVMEHIQGFPLTEYCDHNCLCVAERLRLVAKICSALEHAHNEGVVHRDLKPQNILVTTESCEPKIIDFGIAKVLGRETVLRTTTGRIMGTPRYMSPEQSSETKGTDHRTDIYSIGVILCELLTGAWPIPNEAEAPLLTDCWTQLESEIQTEASAKRGTDPRELLKELQRLQWLNARLLENDRDRRYSTATEVREEIERYLRNEPLAAKAPSFHKRIGKFLSKHRHAALVSLSILVLLSAVGVFLLRETEKQKQERLTTTAMEHPGYKQHLVEGTIYDRNPLPESLRRPLVELSAHKSAHGLLYVKAAVVLAYFHLWNREYQKTVALVEEAFDLLEDVPGRTDLLMIGGNAIVAGSIREKFGRAKDWYDLVCDETELSGSEKEQRAVVSKCKIAMLQANEQPETYSYDEVRECVAQAMASMENLTPYSRGHLQYLRVGADYQEIIPNLSIEGGRLPALSEQQRSNLQNILEQLREVQRIALDVEEPHGAVLKGQSELDETSVCIFLRRGEEAHSSAHEAAQAFETLHDRCQLTVAFQQASRAARTVEGRRKEAEEDIKQAVVYSRDCASLKADKRAAVILSYAALLVNSGQPREALDEIWKYYLDWARDPDFEETLFKAIRQLRIDFASIEDPSWWPEYVRRSSAG